MYVHDYLFMRSATASKTLFATNDNKTKRKHKKVSLGKLCALNQSKSICRKQYERATIMAPSEIQNRLLNTILIVIARAFKLEIPHARARARSHNKRNKLNF